MRFGQRGKFVGHVRTHARSSHQGDAGTAHIESMDFNEQLHPRQRNGTFTDKTQSVPEAALHTDGEEFGYFLSRQEYPGDTRPAIARELDPEDVVTHLKAFDDYLDMFVASIEQGHLCRGVAGRQRAAVASAWVSDASAAAASGDSEVSEFRDGVRRGIVGLYSEKVGYDGPLFELAGPELEDAARRALLIAETKRASAPERDFWRQNLRYATAAEHRGMLVAAAALSGTDRWWGFRDRPREVMTGGF